MIRNLLLAFVLIGTLLAGGCDFFSAQAPSVPGTGNQAAVAKSPALAGLQELPAAGAHWRLPDNLSVEGPGNFHRVVSGAGLLAPQALELAAGPGGRLEYFLDMDSSDDELNYRFQFLSTQGTGRLNIAAIGRDGRTVATVGYVFTGTLPPRNGQAVWIDRRLPNNYQGGWVQDRLRPAELFATQFPAFAPDLVARYRVGIESGNGQHALITELKSAGSQVEGTKITWQQAPRQAVQGEIQPFTAVVANVTDKVLENLTIRLHEPFGYGLVAVGPLERKIGRLSPGETVALTWRIRAQRDSTVNLGQPWELRLTVNKTPAPAVARVDVADPAPGKIFYVMTEDLEPMDAAGYPTAWGNQNGWLDPEEYRVQLIHKAEALNRIAEKHGAFWTHYLAMPALAAGEWAAAQSPKADWRTTLEQVRQSVREQSKRGHEYALHLHSDYDPEVPGNLLSYHAPTDGLWANHLRHGWSHSFPDEGNVHQRGSRTGILFHHLREISKLTAGYPGGEILTARTGSFDFGNGPESEAMSMRAYRLVGLWGNSDADGNAGGITAGDYRRALYLTPPDDINAPAADLKKLGFVEFRPTPRQFIMYDVDSTASLNEKARQGVQEFSGGSRVRAGVHAIVGFSHAMFIMGLPDWRSTAGRHYQALDEHLAYLKREYVDKGLLHFGTATTLVREYLDYYWPEPLVLTGPLLRESKLGLEFALDFLGRNIPVDPEHRHHLTLKIPVRFWGSGLHATLLKNGQPDQVVLLSGDRYELSFVWDDRKDQYVLVIGQRIVQTPTASGKNLLERPPEPFRQVSPLPRQPVNLLRHDMQPRFR